MEVGGVEPAAWRFGDFPLWLVKAYLPWSDGIFDLAVRDLSQLFIALKPRQARVAASFPRHVSARMMSPKRRVLAFTVSGSPGRCPVSRRVTHPREAATGLVLRFAEGVG